VTERERIFGNRELLEIDLNDGEQNKTFDVISRHFGEMPFSDEHDGHHRYYYENPSYGFSDACVYWGILATHKPTRLIEIGSGYSSALALDAIEHLNIGTRCTFIDPYPELALKVTAPLRADHEILGKQVQHIDPTLVAELQENDILFIDSSHVVKTGSDVHFELTELLPRLRPGVIVHFHDVFYPFEYPDKWITRDNKSWNELYFLHAFMLFNSSFKIIYFNDYFRRRHQDKISSLPDKVSARILLSAGGGLWIRRA
jgi:hypothetical protein